MHYLHFTGWYLHIFIFFRFLVSNLMLKFKVFSLNYLFLERSSRPEVFCKGVLRNFAKFTGKHLCQSLFFNKVSGLRTGAGVFLWILRNFFLTEHLRWLLLSWTKSDLYYTSILNDAIHLLCIISIDLVSLYVSIQKPTASLEIPITYSAFV